MTTIARRDSRVYFGELARFVSLDVLVGAWLFLSGFLFYQGDRTFLVNNLFCGGMAALLVLGSFARAWLGALSGAIGLWVIASPFVLSFDGVAGTWSNLVTGIVIALLGFRAWRVRAAAAETGVAPESAAS
jgi:hypothetical protein